MQSHFLTLLSCSHFCISFHLVLVSACLQPHWFQVSRLQVVPAQPCSEGAVGESSSAASSSPTGQAMSPAIGSQIPETRKLVQCCRDCYAQPDLAQAVQRITPGKTVCGEGTSCFLWVVGLMQTSSLVHQEVALIVHVLV